MRNSSFPKKQAVNVLIPENNLDNSFFSILEKKTLLYYIFNYYKRMTTKQNPVPQIKNFSPTDKIL